MPECTNCGTELELDHTRGTDLDGDVVVLYQLGYCPKCGKNFKWVDYFEFTNFAELEEQEDQGNLVFFDGLFAAALSCEQPEFSIIPHVGNFVKRKFIVQLAQKFPIFGPVFLLAIY